MSDLCVTREPRIAPLVAGLPTHYGIFGAGRGGRHSRTRTQQAGEGDPGPLVPRRGGRGGAAGNEPPRGFAPPSRCELERMRLATTLIMGACVLETFPDPPPSRGARAWVLTFRRTICRGENLIEFSCGACGAYMVQTCFFFGTTFCYFLFCFVLFCFLFFELEGSVWSEQSKRERASGAGV